MAPRCTCADENESVDNVLSQRTTANEGGRLRTGNEKLTTNTVSQQAVAVDEFLHI